MKYNFAIIGAGQLGSRHLQGLKQSKLESNIWVIDSSEQSLNIAEGRYNEGDDNHKQTLHYRKEIKDLPQSLDVVILATGSVPRLDILRSLFEHSNVKFIILEKFLFPRLLDYDQATELIKLSGTNVWVNCPRRLFDYYKQINKLIDKSSPVYMAYEDFNWGLCCNSIHFIDIFMKLSGQSLFNMDISKLEPHILESKRLGYIELMGEVTYTTPNGSKLVLSSIANEMTLGEIIIKQNDLEIIISESNRVMKINNRDESIVMPYQSQLTGGIVDSLLSSGICELTDYSESATYHKMFLKEIVGFVNKIQGTSNDMCPIT